MNKVTYIEELPKEKCRSCLFMQTNPGTHHISCKKRNVLVAGSEHGIKNGWFSFPYDLDPIWLDECISFRTKDFKLEEQETFDIYMLLRKETKIYAELLKNSHIPMYKFLITEAMMRLKKEEQNFISEELFSILNSLPKEPEEFKKELENHRKKLIKGTKIMFEL